MSSTSSLLAGFLRYILESYQRLSSRYIFQNFYKFCFLRIFYFANCFFVYFTIQQNEIPPFSWKTYVLISIFCRQFFLVSAIHNSDIISVQQVSHKFVFMYIQEVIKFRELIYNWLHEIEFKISYIHTYVLQFYNCIPDEHVDDVNICFHRSVGKCNVLEITGTNQFIFPVIFAIFI